MAKPGLVLAIGMKKPKAKMDEKPAEEMEKGAEESASDSDFDAGAQGVWDALKEDDLEGFKVALKLAMKSCQYEE